MKAVRYGPSPTRDPPCDCGVFRADCLVGKNLEIFEEMWRDLVGDIVTFSGGENAKQNMACAWMELHDKMH